MRARRACRASAARARAARAPSHPYTLIDPGTFGGPESFANLPGVPLKPQGALIGTADTATPSPSFPDNNPFIVGSDPFTAHAFSWAEHAVTFNHGRVFDLAECRLDR